VEVFSKLSTTYKIQAVNHDTLTAFSSSDIMSWHQGIYASKSPNHRIKPKHEAQKTASSMSNKSIEDEQTFYDYYYHDEDYDGAAATASDTDHR
jgi:hypothetical protein